MFYFLAGRMQARVNGVAARVNTRTAAGTTDERSEENVVKTLITA